MSRANAFALTLFAVLVSGCATSQPARSDGPSTNPVRSDLNGMKLILVDSPVVNGLNQITELNLKYQNDSENAIRFTIETYQISEIDITSEAQDRSPLCLSLNKYVDQLRKTGQRMQPGFSLWHSWDYDTFVLKPGEVLKETATYHANQVGIFQLQAIADLKLDDGSSEHVMSNKVEIAVLPVQEFVMQK